MAGYLKKHKGKVGWSPLVWWTY